MRGSRERKGGREGRKTNPWGNNVGGNWVQSSWGSSKVLCGPLSEIVTPGGKDILVLGQSSPGQRGAGAQGKTLRFQRSTVAGRDGLSLSHRHLPSLD